jgi:methylenetetrahydrofolate dehydrogenase (NADP+) / methenyltetrahydrofolate cyclohydrolase
MLYSPDKIALELENWLNQKIKTLAVIPSLEVFQIGNDFASNKYIAAKRKKCESLGIVFNLHQFDMDSDPSTIEDIMHSLATKKCGIMMQLPLPPKFAHLIGVIPAAKDIDCLTQHYQSQLPPTIGAIDLVLKDILLEANDQTIAEKLSTKIKLNGLDICVVGQGTMVGGPLLNYLKDREATIISINKDTKNPEQYLRLAQIIVTATGVPNLLKGPQISSNCLVIDAATMESDGKLVGDVDQATLPDSVTLCPSPGGIGRLTILYLIKNLLEV